MKKHKEAIEFVEPQSMNFDTKINHAYAEFMKSTADKTKNSKEMKKKGSQVTVGSRRSLKTMTSQELYTRDGGKIELKEEMFDDLLVRGPQAHRQIQLKLKSQKFMKKVQMESEQHYHDNYEHYKPKTAAGERGKIDFATNSIDAPKKKKKEGLDAHAASQV